MIIAYSIIFEILKSTIFILRYHLNFDIKKDSYQIRISFNYSLLQLLP